MGNQALINKLRKERVKLARLEQIQRTAEAQRIAAKKEEKALKREVKRLRLKTSKKLIAKLRRARLSPQAKAAIVKEAKFAKSLFSRFRDFADRQD